MTSDSPFSVPPVIAGDEPFGAFRPGEDSSTASPFARAPKVDDSARTGRKSSSPWRRLIGVGSSAVVLLACVLLGFSFWETRVSGWLAQRSQDQLRQEFAMAARSVNKTETKTAPPPSKSLPALERDQAPPVTAKTVAVPVLPATGELVGRLRIPAIELDWMIVAGTDPATLKKGPGAWLYGAFPGAPGNATLSGHRTTYGGPFRRLGDLEIGDQIFFEAPDGAKSVFEVRGMGVVSPKDVYVTDSGKGVRMTLLTCDPPGTAARRLVIQAELTAGAFLDQALSKSEWTFLGK